MPCRSGRRILLAEAGGIPVAADSIREPHLPAVARREEHGVAVLALQMVAEAMAEEEAEEEAEPRAG